MGVPHYQLVLTTCPDSQVAQRIAHAVVEERLAACVNVLPPMQSVYRWRGRVESASEQLLILKTRVSDYPQIQRRIGELHPYELPEVIAVPITGGLPSYLAWIDQPDTA
jgi:periplasmic divalent cation tolerance protein